MAVSEVEDHFQGCNNQKGLFLRTVHGSAGMPLVARLIPKVAGKSVTWLPFVERTVLRLEMENHTYTEMCFDDENTLLIRARGKQISFVVDFLSETGPYDYIYCFQIEEQTYYMANCYKNNCKYLIRVEKGKARLDQDWQESSALYSRLEICGEEELLFSLKEIETEWDQKSFIFNFEESIERSDREFLDFFGKYPNLPQKMHKTAYQAAYLNWLSIVRKDGFLKRDAMFMSKNWMCSVWSWDHCFNAIALSYGNPEMAWDQFMVLFDLQDPSGLLPDSANDAHVVWNYCKPPVHGWALLKMMENMQLTFEQSNEAFDCLERWTLWWIKYRDYDGDGLYEYNHGNDSGWDNSTVFSVLPPTATPELQALLILQMEALAKLAKNLNLTEKSQFWMKKSQALLKHFLEHMFINGLPVAFSSFSHEIIKNQSLLPYECLILGKRLPEQIREKTIDSLLKSGFLTEYGLSTESITSPFYRRDGYWRGPIWAPSTLMLLDGLSQCGLSDLVEKIAADFITMVDKSGFAENFDALSGEGLRDGAYTWTSSVFFIIAKEYIKA